MVASATIAYNSSELTFPSIHMCTIAWRNHLLLCSAETGLEIFYEMKKKTNLKE